MVINIPLLPMAARTFFAILFTNSNLIFPRTTSYYLPLHKSERERERARARARFDETETNCDLTQICPLSMSTTSTHHFYPLLRPHGSRIANFFKIPTKNTTSHTVTDSPYPPHAPSTFPDTATSLSASLSVPPYSSTLSLGLGSIL